MKKKVLFVVLNEYADWEGAYLATAINKGVMPGRESLYETKVVGPTLSEVHSLGGFRIMPDYSIDNIPEDYAALILIGGDQWKSKDAERVAPIVSDAIKQGKVVGGICAGASFMAAHGFLNNVNHTGNGVDNLKEWGGDNYTNEVGYMNSQAVSDNNIVTANGTGCLEFTRELLLLLKADTSEKINQFYDFQKNGFVR
ncbi:type 1 glutamine amidotransferase family protein [Xylanibacter oryzae]|uniref:type 1 glutamine amidotransferase family protein n=1 Tax=Xylanibacter oryzae TaxID=185293 RepID=UPI0004B77E7F|nr:type 1 glutamine amidotransferase family protein [Xylanibacter oryzae]